MGFICLNLFEGISEAYLLNMNISFHEDMYIKPIKDETVYIIKKFRIGDLFVIMICYNFGSFFGKPL